MYKTKLTMVLNYAEIFWVTKDAIRLATDARMKVIV